MSAKSGGLVIEFHGEAWQELLSAYLDGQVTAEERALVDAHVAACEACQEDLRTLRLTIEVVQALPQAVPPRSFRIEQRTSAPVPSPITPIRPARLTTLYRSLRAATAVAAAFLIVAIGADLLGYGPSSVPVSNPAVLNRQADQGPDTGAAGIAAAPAQAPKAPSSETGGEVQTFEAPPEAASASQASEPSPAPLSAESANQAHDSASAGEPERVATFASRPIISTSSPLRAAQYLLGGLVTILAAATIIVRFKRKHRD